MVEKVGAKAFVGVEDFDADEAVVFPVEGDESGDAGPALIERRSAAWCLVPGNKPAASTSGLAIR